MFISIRNHLPSQTGLAYLTEGFRMSSEAAYFPNALASPSEVRELAHGEPELVPKSLTAQSQCHTTDLPSAAGIQTSEVSDELPREYHATGYQDSWYATCRRHVNTRHTRSHTGFPRDVRRFFIELCVNLHTPAYKRLVNPALNQRNSFNFSDYNVAYIVEKTILNPLVNRSAFLPGAVI
jgi:hypothetical protein